jgi:hypothetical protein
MFRIASMTPVVMALAMTVTGCTTFSRDGGFGEARDVAAQRLGKTVVDPRTDEDRERIQAEVHALLAQPLGPEDAVQVALLSNRGLRGMYAELGIAEADLVQAGRL